MHNHAPITGGLAIKVGTMLAIVFCISAWAIWMREYVNLGGYAMKYRKLQAKLSERGRANLQIRSKERDVLKRLAALEYLSHGCLRRRTKVRPLPCLPPMAPASSPCSTPALRGSAPVAAPVPACPRSRRSRTRVPG